MSLSPIVLGCFEKNYPNNGEKVNMKSNIITLSKQIIGFSIIKVLECGLNFSLAPKITMEKLIITLVVL